MCVYTGLANITNPGTGVQWATVVVLILFQLLNGLSSVWLGKLSPHISNTGLLHVLVQEGPPNP